ncbi:hypothetical protein FW774_05345 (plasmid) [Pedobacter sp. BS3]|uniref:hypothetical protein n=1 Tax=Pedobacter sp. BS3 TaxID=2567937 RepID=UPI0011ED111D|nr:hypothetical protein [Pedobacter sp. BS3]TZF86467.1 hypothetical protein FW774_05345 [Pedobacter sp. BS3]
MMKFMLLSLLTGFMLLSALRFPQPVENRSVKNPFGILADKTENKAIGIATTIRVAKDLGVPYVRTRIWLNKWNGKCIPCEAITAAGLKIILNINAGAPVNGPVPFPTDITAYKKTVREILTKYKPALVSIENEEDNPLYHTGTAEDYINELKAGTEIAHQMGIKVSNGGITSALVAMLTYQDMIQHGRTNEADIFARKIFPDYKVRNLAKIISNNEKIRFATSVLEAIKSSDVDYINFHWYTPGRGLKGADISTKTDVNVLDDITAFLKKSTGKPVITTEIGQLAPSPVIVTNLLQKTSELNMDFVIWYSGDGGDGKAIALQNADGSLRENGKAFKNFIHYTISNSQKH